MNCYIEAWLTEKPSVRSQLSPQAWKLNFWCGDQNWKNRHNNRYQKIKLRCIKNDEACEKSFKAFWDYFSEPGFEILVFFSL